MRDLSICIVNYNTKLLTIECINSIYKNIQSIDFEIIVVDNGSSDGSAEIIQKKFPEVKLIRNVQNLGFSKANNQAIRASEGEFILLLNSDTYCINDVIKKMLDFIKTKPLAGIVGIRLLRPDMSTQRDTYTLPTLRTVLYHLIDIKKLLPECLIRRLNDYISFFLIIGGKEAKNYLKYEKLSHPMIVENISGACMMVRREVIESVGLLDENIFLYYEDADFCKRVLDGGWELWLLPYTGIIHCVGASFGKSFVSFSPERYAGVLYYFSKHKGIVYNLLIRSIFLLFLPIKTTVLLLSHKNNTKQIFKSSMKLLRVITFSPLKIRQSDENELSSPPI